MKKIAIIVLKITTVLFLVLVVFYQLLLSDFNPMFKREDFIAIKEEINKSKNEDFKNFLNLYNKLYNTKSIKFYSLKNSKLGFPKDDCPCLDVARYYGVVNSINFKIPYVSTLYTLKIEKEFSQEDCLKLFLKKVNLLYGIEGIREASIYFFDKKLDNLNDQEILNLVIMLENPILYDPKKNREILKNKILVYERFLENLK
jgi:uncharacterized protein YxeA